MDRQVGALRVQIELWGIVEEFAFEDRGVYELIEDAQVPSEAGKRKMLQVRVICKN
jgi:hypothetical protein